MPIQSYAHSLWRYVWDRNQNHIDSRRVLLSHMMNYGVRMGYSHQETGYAIQLLKQQNKLKWYKSVGWVAKK